MQQLLVTVNYVSGICGRHSLDMVAGENREKGLQVAAVLLLMNGLNRMENKLKGFDFSSTSSA